MSRSQPQQHEPAAAPAVDVTAIDGGRALRVLSTQRAPRPARRYVGAAQRMRLINAMAELGSAPGAQPTVADVVALAGVSRKTFYEFFANRADCVLATIDHALALASQLAEDGWAAGHGWAESVRGG